MDFYYCVNCNEKFSIDESNDVLRKNGLIERIDEIFCPYCETTGDHIVEDESEEDVQNEWDYNDSMALWYPNGKGD